MIRTSLGKMVICDLIDSLEEFLTYKSHHSIS